jgi:transcription-repair coupling factor (superfamily II helicase)
LEYKEKENIFLKNFQYKHTQDQEQCVFEVLEDMSKQKPMDRLLT